MLQQARKAPILPLLPHCAAVPYHGGLHGLWRPRSRFPVRNPQIEADTMSSSYGSPADVPAKTSGKATASLVLGLLSFVMCLFTGIPAIILGIIGLSNIGKSQGRLKGQGVAIAGIVTGAIGTLIASPAVLAGLMLPILNAAREKARENMSSINMQMIAKCMFDHELNRREYPGNIVSADGKPLLSWRVKLLPQLDRADLYRQFHLDEPWDSPHNKKLIAEMPEIFQNPNLAPNSGVTTYLVPVGEGTMFEHHLPGSQRRVSSAMVSRADGVGQTIMLVEADEDQAVPWTKPADLSVDRTDPLRGLGNLRPRGFVVVFADTRTGTISRKVSPANLNKAFSYDGRRFNESPLDQADLDPK